jgi:hypothetical protein
MAALPPEASDIGNRNALDAHNADGLADILELAGLDDRGDWFHGSKLLAREMP